LRAAFGAELFGVGQFIAAFRAEFGVTRQRGMTIRAGGRHFFVAHAPNDLRVLGVGGHVVVNFLHSFGRLLGRDFDRQVGGAVLAQSARLVPAVLFADPRQAARTLQEGRLDLLDRRHEGLVFGLLPLRRTDALGHVGGLVEDAAKQTGSGIERPGSRAQCPGLEGGAVAVSAAVTVKLKLKPPLGAEVAIIAGKLDVFQGVPHENEFELCEL